MSYIRINRTVMMLLLTLMVLVMISPVFPVEIYAAETGGKSTEYLIDVNGNISINGVSYELNSDGKSYSLCGITPDDDVTYPPSDIVIESEINGLPVTGIGYIAIPYDTTSVKIPDSITYIDECAFYDCNKITSITIPDSVTSIGEYAFWGCDNLKTVKLPRNLTKIEDGLFQDCTSLTEITIPGSVKSIGNSAFARCKSLTSIVVPEGVTSIGDSAFLGCISLKSIGLPVSLKSVGKEIYYVYQTINIYYAGTEKQWKKIASADGWTSRVKAEELPSYELYMRIHYNCDNSTTLPGTTVASGSNSYEVTTSGNTGKTGTVAYTGTTSSGNLTIPATVKVNGIKYNVTSVSEGAFKGNTRLASVTIGKNVTSIGSSAFMNCTSLKTVTFASGSKLKSIESSAFKNCKRLAKITIPGGVTKIGNSAFSGCTTLKTVAFASGSKLTSIGSNTFKGCKKLTKITIPNKVTTIGASAFSGCTALSTATIGTGLTKIGKEAFYGCRKLGAVTIKSKKLKSVGSNAFKNIKSTAKIKVPSAKLSAYKKLLKGKGQGKKVKIVKIS